MRLVFLGAALLEDDQLEKDGLPKEDHDSEQVAIEPPKVSKVDDA